MPGVRTARIDFDAKEARVEYDAKRVTLKDLVAALKKVGFRASLKS